MKKGLYSAITLAYILLNGVNAQNTGVTQPIPQAGKFGIGLNLSTNGVGGQLAVGLSKNGKFNGRLEGRYFSTDLTNYEAEIGGTKLVANATVKLGSIGAMFDYHPFGNAFKITAGYALLLNDVSATAITKDSTKFGEISVPPNEVGDIQFGLNVKPSPYLGIGFGRAIPKKRFGFTFEIGAYYTGAPEVSFKSTGMLEPTSANEPILRENLSGLTWWPVMNFGFNFRLGKIEN
ncbi:MAG: hypothetical protein MH472_02440 [Bacteroidia bacterium]|nr:hypothetical protein [Bacteroidia bacterium]